MFVYMGNWNNLDIKDRHLEHRQPAMVKLLSVWVAVAQMWENDAFQKRIIGLISWIGKKQAQS